MLGLDRNPDRARRHHRPRRERSRGRIRSARFRARARGRHVLFDSPRDPGISRHRAGGGRIIPTRRGAFAALRLQALADGIMDASILLVYEGRCRPAERHEQNGSTSRAARSRARSRRSKPRRRCSLRRPTSARSRSPARSGYRDFRFAGTWRTDIRAGRVARRVRRAGAGLCRDQAAAWLSPGTRANAASRLGSKKAPHRNPGHDRAPSHVIRTERRDRLEICWRSKIRCRSLPVRN